MSKPIIHVSNLSKLYHLGTIGATTFGESLERWWYRIRGKEHELTKIDHELADNWWKLIRGKENDLDGDSRGGDATNMQVGPEPNTMWALRDVSFSIDQGEIVGIIGKNGAGKSTLLKILSRITDPTSGRGVIRGRVASLLEVGTGFHPELTGRENIYLNGAILGMRKREIGHKFDEIVNFAEVQKFLDTPVKRYSSGMYMRLAFAIAAHLEPEILLVDEVLAVGDVEFQNKCLGKLADVTKQGRTVLFVSHKMTAIKQLCARTIVFLQGEIAYIGETQEAINIYTQGLEANQRKING